MNQRKQLIEDAAKAIDEKLGYQSRTDWAYLSVVAAEAAFAVFEGAYTPTDDEREALDWRLEQALILLGFMAPWQVSMEQIQGVREHLTSARRIAAGFHRTVQGEPSDAQVSAGLDAWFLSSRESLRESMRAALRAAAETGGEHRG